MGELRFISADSHVQESDEFKMRVPAHFRERLPHMEIIDGGEYEIVEGRKPRRFDVAESRINEDDLNRNFREDPDGGRNIERRLSDQTRDSVVGEVIYCNALLTYLGSPDTEFQMTVAKTYNDWVHETFGERPDRFAPAAILPTLDVPAAIEEALAANPGTKGVALVHCETSTGVLQPLEEIGQLARSKGAMFLVEFASLDDIDGEIDESAAQ